MDCNSPARSPSVSFRKDGVFVILLLAASLFATGSLWLGGEWFVSHEMLHQLVRLLEFDFALRGGQFPVRWCDNLMAGYGYPFFNFYGPLSFALAELFHLAGLSLAASWKAETTLVVWLGGVGMYGLLRRRAGRFGAGAGAMLYLFAPYHLSTLYVRGNLPELTALSVWPWAFWGAEAVARSGRRWRGPAFPAAALAVGALAVSHVLTAYMAAFSLAAWAMFLALEARRPEDQDAEDGSHAADGRPLPPVKPSSLASRFSSTARCFLLLAALGLFGAAVSAFFWLPALHDTRFCPTSVLYERTEFKNHYVYLWQFVVPFWGYGASVAGPEDTMPFQLGIALWLGVAAAAWAMFRRPETGGRGAIAFALTMLAATLFAITPASRPFWDRIPGAAYLQFPWRLLIPATFWASLAGGLAAGAGAARLGVGLASARLRLAAALLLLLPAGFSAPYTHPLFFYQSEQVPDYDPEVLRHVFTDTAEGEYLPLWAEDVPQVPSSRRILWSSIRGQARKLESASACYRFRTEAPAPSQVALDVFWFPGWRARIDGESAETMPVTRHGFVGWDLPASTHEVIVEFGETPLRRSANLVSLTALLLALLWLLAAGGRTFQLPRKRP